MALETQFETMRQIFDLVPHFLFAKDGDSRFLLVNQTMAAAHGMTAEEMVGRTMDEVYDDPALVARYRADDLDVIKGGKSKYISEEPFVDALGAEKTLETTKIPFKDLDSGKPAVLCVSLDITGRRRAEEALRESRAHLNDVQRLAHIGSWTWDIATGKLQWSEEHYRIFGVEPVGRPITFGEALAMVHPDIEP
jgi:PAS domain S-box-containing protein